MSRIARLLRATLGPARLRTRAKLGHLYPGKPRFPFPVSRLLVEAEEVFAYIPLVRKSDEPLFHQQAEKGSANLADWNRLVSQARYFAAFQQPLLLPWFSALEARNLPGQFAFNHLRLSSGVGLLVCLCGAPRTTRGQLPASRLGSALLSGGSTGNSAVTRPMQRHRLWLCSLSTHFPQDGGRTWLPTTPTAICYVPTT